MVQDTWSTFVTSYMRKLPMSESRCTVHLWLVTWLNNCVRSSITVVLVRIKSELYFCIFLVSDIVHVVCTVCMMHNVGWCRSEIRVGFCVLKERL